MQTPHMRSTDNMTGMVQHDMAPRTRNDIMSYNYRSTMGGEHKNPSGTRFANLAKCFQQYGIASSQEEDDDKVGDEFVQTVLGRVLHYSVAKMLMPICRSASRGKYKCVLDAKKGRMGEAFHLEMRTSLAIACKGSTKKNAGTEQATSNCGSL